MAIKDDLKVLRGLVGQWEQVMPESTGANVVTYDGYVYNVIGSTNDPKIGGHTWKGVLEHFGIGGGCYVDNPCAPVSSTHPNFNFGGHVTPNPTGVVPNGGNCLLMPLCSWHSKIAQDGRAYSHTATIMLQLTGYYQGEFAVTFMARMANEQTFSLIYATNDGWETKNLSLAEGDRVMAEDWAEVPIEKTPDFYILLERQQNTRVDTKYAVRVARL